MCGGRGGEILLTSRSEVEATANIWAEKIIGGSGGGGELNLHIRDILQLWARDVHFVWNRYVTAVYHR